MAHSNLLSPQRAAEALDCKRGHVYKLIRSGELNAIKFGPRMVRIEPDELERYKASKCRTHGELESIEENSQPSQDRATADAALSSMRLIRRAQKALSDNSTLKRAG